MRLVVEKQCKGVCRLIKPIGDFARCGLKTNGSFKYNSWCKDCFNIYQQQERAKQPKYESIYTKEFLNQVKILFDQGLGKSKISKELNIHKCKIDRAYLKLGIKNSEATKNKQNPRRTHLQTEKYCKKCDKILAIEEFNFHIDKCGRKRIVYICKYHEQEKKKIVSKQRYEKIKNTPEYLKKSSEYIKNRATTDPNFKLRTNISGIIYKYLKRNGGSKSNKSCLKYLGFSIKELKIHLELLFEFWMNWNNYGGYHTNTWNDNDPSTWRWNIDHIIPQSDLPYISMEDDNFKKCWALTNLRPYSAKLNLLDGISRVRHKNI